LPDPDADGRDASGSEAVGPPPSDQMNPAGLPAQEYRGGSNVR